MRALRLRGDPHPDRRTHRAVQPLDRRDHGHRREGDVQLRRPRRLVADVASRGHGVDRARLRRARACSRSEPVSKLFYLGPMFRRERPQKGRLRQFSQIGVEVIGRDDAAIDAEVLLLLHDLLTGLEIRGAADRAELAGRRHVPSGLSRRRCWPSARRTAPRCARTAAAAWSAIRCACSTARTRSAAPRRPDAPLMLDHLCSPCRAHFDAVCAVLGA